MKALSIKNLSYSYKSNWSWRRFPVLHDLNLEVEEGETFGFLGHNGAGKTTTIKCILRLIKSRPGAEIAIFGKDNKNIESRKSIGYLPEQPYFYDNLKVSELMDLYAVLMEINPKEKRAAIEEALESVNISHKISSKMRNMSKGQIQRIGMAQAILGKPKLLILDEPFSGLDPVGRKEFADLILKLKKEGSTILMSSHILSDVESICDRAAILLDGKLEGIYELSDLDPTLGNKKYELTILGDACPDELKSISVENTVRNNRNTFLIEDKDKAHKALSVCNNTGIEVISFNPVRTSLEDLFIKLVKEK